MQRSAKKMGFAKQEDLDRLAREVEVLKSKLVVGGRSGAAPAKKTSTKKTAPQRSAAKKPVAKKSSAKKSGSKKTVKKAAR
jgi:DNA topoisomerase-1